MEIKRFGDPEGKKIMLLHGNLMCWRQFEDVIPLLEKEFDVLLNNNNPSHKTNSSDLTTMQEEIDRLTKLKSK